MRTPSTDDGRIQPTQELNVSESLSEEPMPLLMTVSKAVKYSGLSRTEIYVRIGTGEIKAKKMRRSTLVIVASLIEAVKNLKDF
jgi:hypothetical protein